MSDRKPTPGPWRMQTGNDGNGWRHQILGPTSSVSSELIADVGVSMKALPAGQHATWDHAAANAALIASAPAIAAELAEARQFIQGIADCDEFSATLAERARAFLAKGGAR